MTTQPDGVGSPRHVLLGYISLLGLPNSYYEILKHIGTKIVGTKYYPGRASSGEAVGLLRDPTNLHDSCAIEVRNASSSKMGHVPSELASKLASYVDRGSVVIQGTVTGPRRWYCYPLTIYISAPGDPAAQGALKTQLLNAGLNILPDGGPDEGSGASIETTKEPGGETQ